MFLPLIYQAAGFRPKQNTFSGCENIIKRRIYVAYISLPNPGESPEKYNSKYNHFNSNRLNDRFGNTLKLKFLFFLIELSEIEQ